MSAAADRRIRGLRPPKPPVDPWKAHGTVVDEERRLDGTVERAATVFLSGAECPFSCAFCDLWRWTIDGPTPRGALPAQLQEEIRRLGDPLPQRLKLYNASNFFDRRAVPEDDLPAIASLVSPFGGVTVESHASTVGPSAVVFGRRIPGRLEVAMGLESVHPTAATQLNKRLDPDTFRRAAMFLRENDVDVRAFVLLGVPRVPPAVDVEWAVRAVTFAAASGASTICIIPVRGGNGEMERLRASGDWTPPTLAMLEDALDHSLHVGGAVVTVDLWDIAPLAVCARCRDLRVARLARINRSGIAEGRVSCDRCGGG